VPVITLGAPPAAHHSKGAFAKYDEALRHEPNWTELKEAREALTNQKS